MDTISHLYGVQPAGPKYRAVSGALRQAIEQGVLAVGDRLPPVRELAWQLQITPGTVARAYTILTDEGVLRAEVGRGTFVAPKPRVEDDRDMRWARHHVAEDTDLVSLFAPKLPDCGQVDMIRDIFAQMGDRPAKELLNYPNRKGFAPARKAALRWLSGTRLGPVNEEDAVLTHGSQNGVMLILQTVLRGARPVVLVEELSYPGFRRAAHLMRAEIVSVPMDCGGIIPEALDKITEKHGAQILCTSPEVHNPTGIVTSDARRREIATVAQARGLHVLEDDCYRLGNTTGQTYRELLPDLGWHVSSFSKVLTPALRVGFAVAPKRHALALRRAAEYGFFGLAQPLAVVIEELMARPECFTIMDAVRAEMARYVRAAVNALGGFDLTWHEEVPFLWLRLPEGWRASAFVQAAEAEGVQLRAAEEFVPRDGFAPHAVRLAINAQVSLPSFEAAMARLRALLDSPPEGIAV
jgi:DNA-binding transcriptional MocR family regulator